MKKVRLLTMAVFFLATAVLFSSCSKTKMNEKRIVGNWKMTKLIVDNENWTEDFRNVVWSFSSGGRCYSSFIGGQGMYDIFDNTLRIYSDYMYDNNDPLYWERVDMNLQINELTKTYLRVEGYYNYYDADGYNLSHSVTIDLKK